MLLAFGAAWRFALAFAPPVMKADQVRRGRSEGKGADHRGASSRFAHQGSRSARAGAGVGTGAAGAQHALHDVGASSRFACWWSGVQDAAVHPPRPGRGITQRLPWIPEDCAQVPPTYSRCWPPKAAGDTVTAGRRCWARERPKTHVDDRMAGRPCAVTYGRQQRTNKSGRLVVMARPAGGNDRRCQQCQRHAPRAPGGPRGPSQATR